MSRLAIKIVGVASIAAVCGFALTELISEKRPVRASSGAPAIEAELLEPTRPDSPTLSPARRIEIRSFGFRRQVEDFASEFRLTAEQRDRFVLAVYDAQEALRIAPRDSAKDDPDFYSGARGEIMAQYTEDLFDLFGSDLFGEMLTSKRWNVYGLLFTAEDEQAVGAL